MTKFDKKMEDPLSTKQSNEWMHVLGKDLSAGLARLHLSVDSRGLRHLVVRVQVLPNVHVESCRKSRARGDVWENNTHSSPSV